jgi:hypothetical protein
MYDRESPHTYDCDCDTCTERNAEHLARVAEMRDRMYRSARNHDNYGSGW